MKIFSSRYVDTSRYKTKEIILEIVRERILSLKPVNKAQTRFSCLCPFHEEKTPSFFIHNNGGQSYWMFKCLSCGRSGDVFRFLMMYENWEFWDALVYIKKHPMNFKLQSIPVGKNQLKIPFPQDDTGEFLWISKEMNQIGFN